MNSPTIIKLDKPDAEMITEIMIGEYMQLTVETLRGMSKPWGQLTEDMQQSIIARLQSQASDAIAKMVMMTANIDHTVLQANLSDIKKGKKEISAKLEFGLHEMHQNELYDYANRQVIVVLTDPADYIVDGHIPEADPDQPPLNNF